MSLHVQSQEMLLFMSLSALTVHDIVCPFVELYKLQASIGPELKTKADRQCGKLDVTLPTPDEFDV